MKNRYVFQNKHQLNKTYKSVAAVLLNNADFPTLTPLFPHKSVHNSFIKPAHKPYISSIKPVLVVVRKYCVYNYYLGARNVVHTNALI